ncbi:MAG: aminopeptidase [Burkholderiales bacterium]
MHTIRFVAVLGLLWLVTGCASVGYYFQAMGGQMEIWQRSRPITKWIDAADTDADLREKLRTVQKIRDFASRELALPDNGSYRKYADLEREYVVWNVFATEEFSIEPVQWCFPIAGCVAYRGYFEEASANEFADGLRRKNLDVMVGGVAAYSTLGWFDDPVLNTFIRYPEVELARMLFHELAHQVVYVKDDSVFNESFATAVELEGTARWLRVHGSSGQLAGFEARQVRRREFTELIARARVQLQSLYASAVSSDEKRLGKAQIFAGLKEKYGSLRTAWGGYQGYDLFFQRPLNNARLVPVATYSDRVPAFRRLFAEQGGDFKSFFAVVREIANLPKEKRALRLAGSLDPTMLKSADRSPLSSQP